LPDDWREQIARRNLVMLRADIRPWSRVAIYPPPDPLLQEGETRTGLRASSDNSRSLTHVNSNYV